MELQLSPCRMFFALNQLWRRQQLFLSSANLQALLGSQTYQPCIEVTESRFHLSIMIDLTIKYILYYIFPLSIIDIDIYKSVLDRSPRHFFQLAGRFCKIIDCNFGDHGWSGLPAGGPGTLMLEGFNKLHVSPPPLSPLMTNSWFFCTEYCPQSQHQNRSSGLVV